MRQKLTMGLFLSFIIHKFTEHTIYSDRDMDIVKNKYLDLFSAPSTAASLKKLLDVAPVDSLTVKTDKGVFKFKDIYLFTYSSESAKKRCVLLYERSVGLPSSLGCIHLDKLSEQLSIPDFIWEQAQVAAGVCHE